MLLRSFPTTTLGSPSSINVDADSALLLFGTEPPPPLWHLEWSVLARLPMLLFMASRGCGLRGDGDDGAADFFKGDVPAAA